jgi:4'-phosphopantetheinyl transferase
LARQSRALHATELNPVRIARGAVHVWTLDLAVPVDTSVLSDDERERAARLRFADDRRRFEVRRALMRALFARYLEMLPASVRYVAGATGKPALRDAPLTFSVSSRDDLGVLAIANDIEIGVDVERVRPLPDLDELVERFVAPLDRPAFGTRDGVVRERRFFQHWTAIEATLKARGSGFDGVADGATFVEFAPHLYRFEPSAHHVATLASYVPVVDVVQYVYGAPMR